ncbi:MAG: MmgE/PrpD family protein [Chloroflexota bacterium]|nr:MmgE/PrpD family protein [Chloroflexota bacterium]
MTNTNSITPALIKYMAQARNTKLPDDVVHKAKHHILDTLAAMVSGSVLKPGVLARQYVEQQGGPPEAQVVGSSMVISAVNAAIANGMMAHADETDDSNGSAGIHPGCAILPAALAMGERENINGVELINSVVLGYDIGSRTTKALGRHEMRARNHLPFSIGGTMGAIAAAGCLAGLEEEQYRDLLSYGAQQASGIMTYPRDTEHIEKAFIFGGMNARNGVMAAEMIQMGFTGVYDTFDGDGNFLVAYSDNPKGEELIKELGSRFEVMATNIKKFCTGFPIQTPAEALLLLINKHSLKSDDIESIVARLPESGAHTVNNRDMPDINLQYIFAVALLDGKISFEAAHSFERMTEKDVLNLRSKITLIGDPELTKAEPQTPSIVEVTTKDGRHLQEHVISFKGKADNPLTTEEVGEKALDLMEPILGQSRANELIDAINNLETVSSVRDLRQLLAV